MGSVSKTSADPSVRIEQSCTRCYEHRDTEATAVCVDRSGEWVLLAGRPHIGLQHLGSEDGALRKFYRNSKYDVSAAEFGRNFCAIATSDIIDVVDWNSAEPRTLYTLRGHTRLVTDIDWHNRNPQLLCSCSIDTFSHIWDLRDARKPILSLNAVCMSGATQVGFSRVSGNLLAAAHDGDLRIWDIRKGSSPTHYITAHQNRVHGINWSHRRETCLATASQDGTVKYFDIQNPRRAEKIITTTSPVWRARYTPIGNGLVSIVVPHSLLLWSNSKQTDPICSFVGHSDVILDFAWRPNLTERNEIELVTWSRDRTLRLWKIDQTMLRLCEPDMDCNEQPAALDITAAQNPPLARTGTPSRFLHSPSPPPPPASLPPRSVPIALDSLQISRSPPPHARSLTDQPTCALHHEFSLLNTNIPHVEVDVLNALKRYAIFKVSAGGHVIVLQATFPTEYPCPRVPPEFSFCPGTSLQDHHQSKLLLKTLRQNALHRVKRSRTCLEQCLRALVGAMKKCGGSDMSQLRLQSPRLEGALSGALHDACIPFPRTSCASFNGIGLLVTFAQPLTSKRLTLRRNTQQNLTPRKLCTSASLLLGIVETLSSINGGSLLLGTQPVLYAHRDSAASFYPDRMPRPGKNRTLSKSSAGSGSALVHIFEAARLLNISRTLAAHYSLERRDLLATCRHNQLVCETNGRADLQPIWLLAELIAAPECGIAGRRHRDPHKKRLLESLITHYASVGDLQTAVVLACTFDCTTAADTEQHHQLFTSSPNQVLSAQQQQLALQQATTTDAPSFIRRSKRLLFNDFKRVYGELLYGWQLLSTRALILKQSRAPLEWVGSTNASALPGFVEPSGQRPLRGRSSAAMLNCTLCCQPVRGAANVCLACRHGGHTGHMLQWFGTHNSCASGCGCLCLQQMTQPLPLAEPHK